MRLMLVTSLMLAPALLHAQPLIRTVSDRPAADAPRRVSTGVTAPKLLKSVAIVSSGRSSMANPQHVSVAFMVSKEGVPTGIKVISAVDPTFGQSVAQSVAQYRYEPGTLDGLPADVPVNLELTVVPSSN